MAMRLSQQDRLRPIKIESDGIATVSAESMAKQALIPVGASAGLISSTFLTDGAVVAAMLWSDL